MRTLIVLIITLFGALNVAHADVETFTLNPGQTLAGTVCKDAPVLSTCAQTVLFALRDDLPRRLTRHWLSEESVEVAAARHLQAGRVYPLAEVLRTSDEPRAAQTTTNIVQDTPRELIAPAAPVEEVGLSANDEIHRGIRSNNTPVVTIMRGTDITTTALPANEHIDEPLPTANTAPEYRHKPNDNAYDVVVPDTTGTTMRSLHPVFGIEEATAASARVDRVSAYEEVPAFRHDRVKILESQQSLLFLSLGVAGLAFLSLFIAHVTETKSMRRWIAHERERVVYWSDIAHRWEDVNRELQVRLDMYRSKINSWGGEESIA